MFRSDQELPSSSLSAGLHKKPSFQGKVLNCASRSHQSVLSDLIRNTKETCKSYKPEQIKIKCLFLANYACHISISKSNKLLTATKLNCFD